MVNTRVVWGRDECRGSGKYGVVINVVHGTGVYLGGGNYEGSDGAVVNISKYSGKHKGRDKSYGRGKYWGSESSDDDY